jgi:hypothetical protein
MGPTVRSTPVPGRVPETGAVKLFTIPMASTMSDRDVSSLMLDLDFDTQAVAAGSAPETRLVSARLDHNSGLFLVPGEGQGQWGLEARTWGHPDSETVHRWSVSAATAARRIDPTVSLPSRQAGAAPVAPAVSVGHVGRVENTRFAGLRRRLTGG